MVFAFAFQQLRLSILVLFSNLRSDQREERGSYLILASVRLSTRKKNLTVRCNSLKGSQDTVRMRKFQLFIKS